MARPLGRHSPRSPSPSQRWAAGSLFHTHAMHAPWRLLVLSDCTSRVCSVLTVQPVVFLVLQWAVAVLELYSRREVGLVECDVILYKVHATCTHAQEKKEEESKFKAFTGKARSLRD